MGGKTFPRIERFKRHDVQFELGLMCCSCGTREASRNSNYCPECREIMLDQSGHWYQPSPEKERMGEEFIRNEHRLAAFEAKRI